MKIGNFSKGFLLVELMLAAAIFSVFSFAIVVAVLQGGSAMQSGVRSEFARQFAIEGIEKMRALRSQSFDELKESLATGVRISNGKLELSGEYDEKDGYRRTISIQKVYRDQQGNIKTSGETEDSDLRLVTSKVTKEDYSLEFSAYLSRREIPVPVNP